MKTNMIMEPLQMLKKQSIYRQSSEQIPGRKIHKQTQLSERQFVQMGTPTS